jgi:hypothetical protein
MSKAPNATNTNAVDRTWWLAGPVGVYHKFSWEFGQAYDLLNDQQDLTPAAYQAMNACITAWSLVDWICADMDEHNAWGQVNTMAGVKDSASFRQKARSFRELSACQQIANAAKHRSLGKGYQPGYSVHDELIPCEEDGKLSFMRRMTVRFPGGEFDIRILLHEVYIWWSRSLVELGYLP